MDSNRNTPHPLDPPPTEGVRERNLHGEVRAEPPRRGVNTAPNGTPSHGGGARGWATWHPRNNKASCCPARTFYVV